MTLNELLQRFIDEYVPRSPSLDGRKTGRRPSCVTISGNASS
jgi:hypothetical protein